jgi:hypothetical protein
VGEIRTQACWAERTPASGEAFHIGRVLMVALIVIALITLLVALLD